MKNIFIISYTLLLVSCFNFEPLESTIIFKNNCSYKIEVHGGNNIYPNKFILEKGRDKGFSGVNNLSEDNSKYFVLNGKKKSFFISPDSHEYNQILIACPGNTKLAGNKNQLQR